MNETESTERPNTAEADELGAERLPAPGEAAETTMAGTETDEFAELEERAEAGDEAAATALEEAGEAQVEPGEVSEEARVELEAEAAEAPSSDDSDDITDVPTEEATVFEAEAERDLAADTIEGEDAGPEAAAGPDRYLEPEEELVEEVAEPSVPEAEPAQEEQPARVEAMESEAAHSEAEVAEPEVAEPEGEVAEPEGEVAKPVAPAVPEAAPAEEDLRARTPFDGPGEWYVIHTYAGYENKVKANLQSRIGSMQMEEKIFDVVIPMEDVMEIKGGKKQVVQKKVFPGYLLVKMVYDNDSWYVVRNTPGVTGFVSSGTGTKPTPLSRREVEKILAVKQETQVKPQYRLEWEEGDVVRIVAGPFADFTGTIAEINVEQSKLKVMVNIFDRETPVELAFDQVAKA